MNNQIEAAVSTLILDMRLTVIHDGETIEEIGRAELLDALKGSIRNLFSDEEIELDKCSILIKGFSYDDNIEALRKAAILKLQSLSPDQLVDFMEDNNV